jgi:hypothetical protein
MVVKRLLCPPSPTSTSQTGALAPHGSDGFVARDCAARSAAAAGGPSAPSAPLLQVDCACVRVCARVRARGLNGHVRWVGGGVKCEVEVHRSWGARFHGPLAQTCPVSRGFPGGERHRGSSTAWPHFPTHTPPGPAMCVCVCVCARARARRLQAHPFPPCPMPISSRVLRISLSLPRHMALRPRVRVGRGPRPAPGGLPQGGGPVCTARPSGPA